MDQDELCTCAAQDDEHPHTVGDHRSDCTGWPPCGGCWSCIAMTVHHWRRMDGTSPKVYTPELVRGDLERAMRIYPLLGDVEDVDGDTIVHHGRGDRPAELVNVADVPEVQPIPPEVVALMRDLTSDMGTAFQRAADAVSQLWREMQAMFMVWSFGPGWQRKFQRRAPGPLLAAHRRRRHR